MCGGGLEEALSIKQTHCVNGIFILFVFLVHIKWFMLLPLGYTFQINIDGMYSKFFECVGQLIVVPFLFYSGYGIVERIKEDSQYIKDFATHRILPLYLNFLIALVCYIILNILIIGGACITSYTLLKSVFFQYSFGNPTWFLFATFYLYIVSWLVFRNCNNRMYCVIYLTLSCAIYVYCMRLRIRPTFWYNTIFSYAYGTFVSLYKQEIVAIVKKHFFNCIWICALLFVSLKVIKSDMCGMRENLAGMAFISIVVLVTYKFEINNTIIMWMGTHVFPIYMYHLLYFFLFKNLLKNPINYRDAHIAVVISFIMTCLTAYLFKFWRIRSISWLKNFFVFMLKK